MGQMPSFFVVVQRLLDLQDEHQKMRCDRLLSYENGILAVLHARCRGNRSNQAAGFSAARSLMMLAIDNTPVTEYLLSMRGQWRWLDKWVFHYVTQKFKEHDAIRFYDEFRQWHEMQ